MKYFLLVSLIILFSNYLHASEIGGNIKSDTTLTAAGNPYYVTSDIKVAQGVKLFIEAGVELYFRGSMLYIYGELNAVGSHDSPILFTNDTSVGDNWGGINFMENATGYDSTNNTGCRLINCIIKNTRGSYGAVFSRNPRILVDSCDFSNFREGVELWGGGYVLNSKFHDAPKGAGACDYGSVVKGNTFTNLSTDSRIITTGIGIYSDNKFINLSGGSGGSYSSCIIGVYTNCIIQNNSFINNTAMIAIGILGEDNQIITNNYFENNKINLFVDCERHPLVEHNCFRSYINYNIFVTGDITGKYTSLLNDCSNHVNPADINMANNTFYQLNDQQIQQSIYDWNADVGEPFTVIFKPVSSTSDCNFTGVEEIELTTSSVVKITPNPASNEVNIILPNIESGKIICDIFNPEGVRIQSETRAYETSGDKYITIGTKNIPNGLYYIILRTHLNVYSSSFVVIK